MKSNIKRKAALILGIGVLATSLSPGIMANNLDPETGKKKKEFTLSEKEVNNLLEIYQPMDEILPSHLKVKIYDQHDHLIYSDKVEFNKIDSDLRLNALLGKADLLTDIDNTKIYKLK